MQWLCHFIKNIHWYFVIIALFLCVWHFSSSSSFLFLVSLKKERDFKPSKPCSLVVLGSCVSFNLVAWDKAWGCMQGKAWLSITTFRDDALFQNLPNGQYFVNVIYNNHGVVKLSWLGSFDNHAFPWLYEVVAVFKPPKTLFKLYPALFPSCFMVFFPSPTSLTQG